MFTHPLWSVCLLLFRAVLGCAVLCCAGVCIYRALPLAKSSRGCYDFLLCCVTIRSRSGAAPPVSTYTQAYVLGLSLLLLLLPRLCSTHPFRGNSAPSLGDEWPRV